MQQVKEIKTDLEKAKRKLEFLLNREWQLRGTAPEEYLGFLQKMYPNAKWVNTVAEESYFLRRDMPEIFARGTNQIVFSLDGGYAGKATTIHDKSRIPTHYVFANGNYATASESTVKVLRELGFDVPEHHYVKVEKTGEIFKVTEHGLAFVICADLTENGRYKVEDVDERHFQYLNNGKKLREEFKHGVRTLLDISKFKNTHYSMAINGHGTIMNSLEAIERTFLIQIGQDTHTGKLVLGDLDNITLR